MNISDKNNILEMLGKLDNFSINKSNKESIANFIEQLKINISSIFGSDHKLVKKLDQVKFTPPKAYFPEMSEIEQSKSWSAGINGLKKILIEIIDATQNLLDLDDIQTLESVITSGIETTYIEFKSTLRWDLKLLKVNNVLEKVVLKTVCALNNFEGGSLFIGVSDDGKLLGLDNDYKTFKNGSGTRDDFELCLRNLLNNSYSAAYVAKNIQLLFPKPQNIEICRVKVIKGTKPLFLKVGNSKGDEIKERFYVRSGNQSVELDKIPELVDFAIKHFGQ